MFRVDYVSVKFRYMSLMFRVVSRWFCMLGVIRNVSYLKVWVIIVF